jgi:PAS domain S-box-containing protein
MTLHATFSERWQSFVQRHLIWVFVIALVIAFIPMTMTHFVLERAVASEEETANIINVAGRQRMLSQRLTLMINRLATNAERGFETADIRATIQKDLDFLIATHERLAFETRESLITEQDHVLEKIYFAEPDNLNERVRVFAADIDQVLSVPDYAVNAQAAQLERINGIAPNELLEALDNAVSAYERRGYLAIKEIRNIEFQLWGLSAFILIAEFFLIFLPVHRLLRGQVVRLSANERLFRSIYEKSPIMLHSVDKDGHLRVVSNFWLEQMGYASDEVIGQHLSKFMTEESARRALDIYLPKMVREGSVSGVDYQLVKKSGAVIDVVLSAQSQYDDDGDFLRSFAAMVDLTHERAMQSEMEKNAQAMQAFHQAASIPGLSFEERIHRVLRFGNIFFETSMAIVSKINGDKYEISYVAGPGELPPPGTILECSDTYCMNMLKNDQPVAIDNVQKSEFSTHPCYEAFNLDTYIGVRLMVRGQPYGTLNFTAVNPKPEPFDDVEIAFIGLLGQWVSSSIEQEMIAGQLNEARFAAETANATKSAFLANMSHEIRTPLNAIIGLTELTLKTELEEKQRYNLERVSDAGKNLLGIINDILDFSKIEAGKLEIEITEFELDDVLKNLSSLVGARAEEQGLEVLIWVDPEIPPALMGDSLRLGQILVNLMSNAIKFTEQGEVVVRAELEALHDDSVNVVFSVSDSGIGMSEEQVSKLFRPFVQADQSTTRMFGGTGLGLSISKQLTEAMNGQISVESKEGEGSTFKVRLPFKVGTRKSRETPIMNIDPSQVRVLIVDDNDIARDMLEAAVYSMGFITETAHSGQEALDKLITAAESDSTYDLILLDWQMPEMDGVETARKIRELSNYTRTPTVFMVSAYAVDEVADELAEIGVKTFLPKPINTSHLFDKMLEMFSVTGAKGLVPVTNSPEDQGQQAVVANARILLAEDNELNQAVAVGILEGAGFSVDVVANGREAINVLRKNGPGAFAAVLMDIQMPEIDGITATRLIRVEDGFDDLPIIAMTAHALIEERKRCTAAGMDAHIPKPVDSRELISKLNSFIKPDAPTAGANLTDQVPDDDEPTVDAIQEKDPAMDNNVTETTPSNDGDDDTYYDIEEVKGRLMLPEDVLFNLVKRFIDSYEDIAVKISTLVDDNDFQKAAELVHSAKGVSGSLGANALYEKCTEIEGHLRSENNDKARAAMPDFVTIAERTIAVMKTALKRHQAS